MKTLLEDYRWAIELIGIVSIVGSLIFVAAELNQSQNAMESAAMAARNERQAEINQLGLEYGVNELSARIVAGEDISDEETYKLRVLANTLMWHMETVHFEYNQGMVDEELWESTIRSLRRLRNEAWFNYVYPRWGRNQASASHRSSFIELVNSLVE